MIDLILQPGECLWLIRRRAGVNQAEAAATRGMSVEAYRLVEQGLQPPPFEYKCLNQVTPGEFCAIMRGRAGWTMPVAAKRIGISRMTLWKAEHDQTTGVNGVRAYWEGAIKAGGRLADTLTLRGAATATG